MPKLTGTLTGRERIAAGTWAFTLDPGGVEFPFRPGQTIDVTLADPAYPDPTGNTRTFSLAAAPGRPGLRIAMRVRGGAFKRSLLEAPLGTALGIAGPYGSFTLPHQPVRAVLLAGGIGVTPFRAMVEDARLRNLEHALLLVHANRAPAETPFLEELRAWSRDPGRFRYVPTMTRPPVAAEWSGERRAVGRALLADVIPDPGSHLYWVAGPEGFVVAVVAALGELGVDEDRVRVEEFPGYEDGEHAVPDPQRMLAG